MIADPAHADIEISIRWPYYRQPALRNPSSTTRSPAQADDFIAPRFLPQSNDPGYGVIACWRPLANAAAVDAARPSTPRQFPSRA